MKLFRVDGEINGVYKNLGWVGSKKAARKAVTRVKKEHGFDELTNVTYDSEEIPKDKEGLLAWLNEWSNKVYNDTIITE